MRIVAPLTLAFLAILAAASAGPPRENAAAVEWFETKVRPILADRCYICHSADTKPAGGLRVDDRNGLLTGGNSGPAVVPGDPKASLLLQRITHANQKRRMPKEGEALNAPSRSPRSTRWIREGAHWPAVKVPASLGKPKEWYEPLRKEHWAWQPLEDPKLPPVKQTSWPKGDLDRFILAGLEQAGLEPVAAADKLTLLRRVSFDLTGLPPSPQKSMNFSRTALPTPPAATVDRLLASPRFGERWGRHWLDVARFAESTGPSRNIPYPHAWRYRDYVIDAVNANVPFDRFVTEQIAGDLLPASSTAERNRLLIATGFLALGVKDVNQRFKVRFVMDNVDDQIDAVSRSILGLTVTCAATTTSSTRSPPPTITPWQASSPAPIMRRPRNKMGGGGLDYYDPPSSSDCRATLPPPPVNEVRALEGQGRRGENGVGGNPRHPGRSGQGPDGFPKQRPFRAHVRTTPCRAARPNRSSRPRPRGPRRAGFKAPATPRSASAAKPRRWTHVRPGVPDSLRRPRAESINPGQSGRLELAALARQPAQSAHAQGDCQPRLVPPVRPRHCFDGRQLRHHRRRSLESRPARPSRDPLHPRRLVNQRRARDRSQPVLSAWLEAHAEASRLRSGKRVHLAPHHASPRHRRDSRRSARRHPAADPNAPRLIAQL